jgi:hypothetical protein
MKEIKIPKFGYFPRNKMPQVGPKDKFLDNLKKHDIKYNEVSVESSKLKPLQAEFDKEAVKSIIDQPRKAQSAIIISKEKHIMDGHHRWLANYNTDKATNAIQVDLPTVDLMKFIKSLETTAYKDIHHVNSIKKVVKEYMEERKYK